MAVVLKQKSWGWSSDTASLTTTRQIMKDFTENRALFQKPHKNYIALNPHRPQRAELEEFLKPHISPPITDPTNQIQEEILSFAYSQMWVLPSQKSQHKIQSQPLSDTNAVHMWRPGRGIMEVRCHSDFSWELRWELHVGPADRKQKNSFAVEISRVFPCCDLSALIYFIGNLTRGLVYGHLRTIPGKSLDSGNQHL